MQPMLKVFLIAFGLSTVISQSAMDFFSGLILLTIFLLGASKRLNERVPFQDLFPGAKWNFLAWFSIVGLGLFINQNSTTPIWKNLYEFRWILELYALAWALKFVSPDEKAFRIWAWGILVVCIYSIASYFAGYSLLIEGPEMIAQNAIPYYRAGGPFQHAMPFGHVIAMAGCLLFGWLLIDLNCQKYRPSIFWIAALFAAITLLLTMTRGAWIGAFFAVICQVLMTRPRWIFHLIGVVALFIGIGVLGSPQIKERLAHSIQRSNVADDERTVVMRANWLIFKENPILGIGYSENGRRLRETYDKMGIPVGFFEGHAHNQYLHWLAGTGFLGLICYLFFAGSILWQSFKTLRKKTLMNLDRCLLLGSFGAQICFLVGGMTESSFSTAKTRFAYLFMIAIAIWIIQKQQHVDQKTSVSA